MRIYIKHIGIWILLGFALSQCSTGNINTDQVSLKTHMDTVSYIIGQEYGIGIRDEKIDANREAVYKGLSDGLDGKSVLPDSIKNAIIDQFNEELKIKLEEEGKAFLEMNKMESRRFLEENIDVEGVVELANGLQYKILKPSNGPKPSITDSVLVHYRAMYINRDVFDMSYDRGPAGIKLNTVIKGLSDGIILMNEGAIYELYIPSELAYGDVPFANIIPAGSALIYTIELIEIIKE